MMNPYLLLGAVVFWLASVVTAGWMGWDYRDGKVAQQQKRAIDSAIKEHNDDVAIDMQAAFEWGARRTAAQSKSDAQTGAIAGDTLAHPLPADCRLAPDSVRVLNNSVKLANDLTPAPIGLSDTVSAPAGIDKRGGSGAPRVGGTGVGAGWSVPAPAR